MKNDACVVGLMKHQDLCFKTKLLICNFSITYIADVGMLGTRKKRLCDSTAIGDVDDIKTLSPTLLRHLD